MTWFRSSWDKEEEMMISLQANADLTACRLTRRGRTLKLRDSFRWFHAKIAHLIPTQYYYQSKHSIITRMNRDKCFFRRWSLSASNDDWFDFDSFHFSHRTSTIIRTKWLLFHSMFCFLRIFPCFLFVSGFHWRWVVFCHFWWWISSSSLISPSPSHFMKRPFLEEVKQSLLQVSPFTILGVKNVHWPPVVYHCCRY